MWIKETVRQELLKQQSGFFPLETGGILMGYAILTGSESHWVVKSATGPGSRAKHTRYRFSPDDNYHISEAKRHYHQTDGSEYYLGDWHTHPNGSCCTSVLDRITLHRNARRAHHLQMQSLMLIIGGQVNGPKFGAYVEKSSLGLFKSLLRTKPVELRFFE